MLTVLLAVVTGAIAVRLVVQMLSLGSEQWRAAFIDFRLDKVADITIFAAGIVFVVWFRRARINAESRDWRQRRARGWAFWGWIVPVLSLWIPFQLMGDIWQACPSGSAGRPRGCPFCGGQAGCSPHSGNASPGRICPLAPAQPACACWPHQARC